MSNGYFTRKQRGAAYENALAVSPPACAVLPRPSPCAGPSSGQTTTSTHHSNRMLPSSSQNAKAKRAATSLPRGPRLGGGTGREASATGVPRQRVGPMLLTQPFVLSLSKHEQLNFQPVVFFRSPPFGKLRANGKSLCQQHCLGHQGHRVDLHLRQLLGQQLGGLRFALCAMIGEVLSPSPAWP